MPDISEMTEGDVVEILGELDRRIDTLYEKGEVYRQRLLELRQEKALFLIKQLEWTPEIDPGFSYIRLWCHDTSACRGLIWEVFDNYHDFIALPIVPEEGAKEEEYGLHLNHSDFVLYITFNTFAICRHHISAWGLRVNWSSAKDKLDVLRTQVQYLEEVLAEQEG